MADKTENLNEPMNPQTDAQQTDPGEPEITLEDLQTQLTEARAERERYKNALSKSNTEAADWKRKFRERQTAEEQAADAKREAEELQKQQMAAMQKELAILKATSRYLKEGMDEKLAGECAGLEAEGDMESLISKMSAHFAAKKDAEIKAWQAEYLKNRPDIKAGNGEDGEEEEDPFLKAFNNPDAY